MRSLSLLAVLMVLCLLTTPASAKLPPVDARIDHATIVEGDLATVRMWFVDEQGRPLAASDVAAWGFPQRVRGWMWAYPEEAGRPDSDHVGLRIGMRLRDGRYVGHFRPDEPGRWLVIPFGADYSMPDTVGPSEPMRLRVLRPEPVIGALPSASVTATGGHTVPSTLMLLAAAGTCTWLALRWMRARALRR